MIDVRTLSRHVALLAVVTLATGIAAPAHAWNDAGHMAVAYVAYQQLTPATRDRVKQLLKLNPDYRGWLPKGTAVKDRDRIRFMIASTWADDIKRKSGYQDDGSANGDRPDGASSRRNIGYADHLRHKYWHFVDMPFTRDGTPLPTVNGDNGGNGVAVQCAACPEKLHAFWDGAFASDSASPSAVMAAAQALPAPDPVLAAKSDVGDWIAESFQAAQQKVYVAPVGADAGPFSLSKAYANRARAVANVRIALAGARLANVLNTELK